MAETNLSQALEVTNDAASYDAHIKYLLADKQILARILKYSIREFEDMTIEDIISGIGDDIEVASRPLDAGLSNIGRVNGSNTEDNIPGEGKIFYDIRFSAYHKKTEMKFLINIEAQKSSDSHKLGYHLENRMVFYLSRMVSAQKQTEFYNSDYDDLKNVRSIWICMDSSEDEGSIEEISLNRKTVFGNKENTYDLDLMKGIVINIRIGKNIEESKNVLISMLEKLISPMDLDEKKRILTDEYGMIMTTELERKVNTMCNWSEFFMEYWMEQGLEDGRKQGIKQGIEEGIEKGIEKGIEQGIERGIEQGIEQGIERGIRTERLNAIERMLNAGATKAQIISYGYTEEEFAEKENVLYSNV